MSDADRYAIIVCWSEGDQYFIGCCPRLVIGCNRTFTRTVMSCPNGSRCILRTKRLQ